MKKVHFNQIFTKTGKYIYIFLFLISCNNNSNDAKINKICFNDTLCISQKGSYKNGTLKYTCSLYNKIKNNVICEFDCDKNLAKTGYYIEYYPNGQKRFVGNYIDNKESGLFYFYHNSGKLKKIVQFLIISDTNVSKPNQEWYFDNDNDTIFDHPSSFYTITKKQDTIQNEEYEILIKYFGSVYDSTQIYLCEGFNADYSLTHDTFECQSLYFKNDTMNLIKQKNIKEGLNYIRGIIYNYTYNKKNNKTNFIKTYFIDSFFKK